MEIPKHLLNQIEIGEVCLLLGAGCSITSRKSGVRRVPSTEEFCINVCNKAGIPFQKDDPKDVFQAVKYPAGPLSRADMKQLFESNFTNCLPAPEANRLMSFVWRRMYTFNVDDVIRNTQKHFRSQRLKPINAMREARTEWRNLSECQYIQLHGYAGEFENGLIFSREEYARHITSKGWYESVGEDFSNHTLLVIGSSLEEPILDYQINQFIQSYSDGGRSYLITPNPPSPIRMLSLKNAGFEHISGSLEDFVHALEKIHPNGLTPTDIAVPAIESKSRPSIAAEDLDALRSFIPMDRKSIMSNKSFGSATDSKLGRKFYDGYGPEPEIVIRGIPADLKQDDHLIEGIDQILGRPNSIGVCIVGESGCGKSTFTYNYIIKKGEKSLPTFIYSDRGVPLSKAFGALERYLEAQNIDRSIILVDELHIYAEQIGELIGNGSFRRIQIITSARKGEWKSRLSRQTGNAIETLTYERFVADDVDEIISKLSKYYANPIFTKLSASSKREKLLRANKQILVALKEATSSSVFDETIKDEYERLSDDSSRLLLGIICLASIARVGITPGMCKSIFKSLTDGEGYSSAIEQLDGIVDINRNGRLVARHEIYASYIAAHLLTEEFLYKVIHSYFGFFSKFEMPVIRNLDKLDSQLFKYSLNNTNLYELFGKGRSKENVKKLFESFEVEFQLDGHYWLQMGLFLRKIKEHQGALAAMIRSVDAYPQNTYARHALAQQKLIVASKANRMGPLEKRYIDEAVEELISQHELSSTTPWRANSEEYPIVTLANHHVDALIALGHNRDAKIHAREYFNIVETMWKGKHNGDQLNRTRAKMLAVATTA